MPHHCLTEFTACLQLSKEDKAAKTKKKKKTQSSDEDATEEDEGEEIGRSDGELAAEAVSGDDVGQGDNDDGGPNAPALTAAHKAMKAAGQKSAATVTTAAAAANARRRSKTKRPASTHATPAVSRRKRQGFLAEELGKEGSREGGEEAEAEGEGAQGRVLEAAATALEEQADLGGETGRGDWEDTRTQGRDGRLKSGTAASVMMGQLSLEGRIKKEGLPSDCSGGFDTAAHKNQRGATAAEASRAMAEIHIKAEESLDDF